MGSAVVRSGCDTDGVLRLGLLALTTACLHSESATCPSGDVVCPAGTICRAITDPADLRCVLPEQLAACGDKDELEMCALPATDHAYCHSGVCFEAVCGDRLVNPEEVCDDGNPIAGDGCASCLTLEVCGNGIVDPITPTGSEVCDDGNLLGHDGCNACVPEQSLWDALEFVPAARINHALVFDQARHQFVMFGGATQSTGLLNPTDETWESRGAAGWGRVPTTLQPSPRFGHAMAYDAARRRTVLFGGQNGLGDTWEWDGVTWLRKEPAVSPPARGFHTMIYDSRRERVILYGGLTPARDRSLGDTWAWDGTTWTELTGSSPGTRHGHTMTYDPSRDRILVVGGERDFAPAIPVIDAWQFDGTAWTIAAAPPSKRTAAASAYDAATQTIIVAGGIDTDFATNTWIWNGTSWTIGPAGPDRYDAALAADPRGTLIMFGGINGSSFTNDAWSWSGSAWIQEPAATAPAPRARMAYAFDPVRSLLVAHGGYDASGALVGDTWSFSNGRWNQSTPTPAPAARYGSAMAYDGSRDRMILFGGKSATTVFQGTWEYRNGAWRDLMPPTTPPARLRHALAYDVERDSIVMFGGATGSDLASVALDDTWEWNGADWTPLVLSAHPPARAGHALVYDPLAHQIVLVGGQALIPGATSLDDRFGRFDDVWALDRENNRWVQRASFVGPREGHTVDRVFGRLRVFGGFAGNLDPVSDTWVFGSTWEQVHASRASRRGGHAAFPSRDGTAMIVWGGELDGTYDAPTRVLGDVQLLRTDNIHPYELCEAGVDNDLDGLVGCADADCWASCTPLCPPGAVCRGDLPRCGDALCNSSLENCRSCPSDCMCASVCGDAHCDPGEAAASCPGDCP